MTVGAVGLFAEKNRTTLIKDLFDYNLVGNKGR